MNRRQFLLTPVLAPVLASAQNPEPPKPAKIRSSVMLWTLKGSLEERVVIAAKAGMQSVELVGEYADWSDSEMRAKKRFINSFGMSVDAILATPNWTNRPVSMVNPAHREAFLKDVQNAILAAQKLETPQIILMSGNTQPGLSYRDQFASLVGAGKRAAELASKAGNITLIFEPLNSKVNHKGYFLTTCGEGLKLVKAVNSPHFKLLFDLYHEEVQAGNVIPTLENAWSEVAAFHVADAPGRHEPGSGKMNWPEIYTAIGKTAYDGYICMEYLPLSEPAASLTASVDDMRQYLKTS